jgi:hypothetical protein
LAKWSPANTDITGLTKRVAAKLIQQDRVHESIGLPAFVCAVAAAALRLRQLAIMTRCHYSRLPATTDTTGLTKHLAAKLIQ